MLYEVYLHPDGRAACPVCGGMAKTTTSKEYLHCIDCSRIFKAGSINQYNEKTVTFEGPDKKEDKND